MNRLMKLVTVAGSVALLAAAAAAQPARPATAPAPAPVPVNVTVKAPPVNVTVQAPEAKPKPPVTAEDYLAAGRAALADGRIAEAIRLLAAGRDESPWSLPLMRWLAEAYWADLQAEEAVDLFKQVLRRSTGHPVATERLAMIRKVLRDVDAAVKIAADLRDRGLAADALAVLENVAAARPVARRQAGWLLEKARSLADAANWAGLHDAVAELRRHQPAAAGADEPTRLHFAALVGLGKYDEAAEQYAAMMAMRRIAGPRPLPWELLLAKIDWGRGDKPQAVSRLMAAVTAAEKKPATKLALLNESRLRVAQWALTVEAER